MKYPNLLNGIGLDLGDCSVDQQLQHARHYSNTPQYSDIRLGQTAIHDL